jgi:hypothetical protein
MTAARSTRMPAPAGGRMRDLQAVVDLLYSLFRRDVLVFFPGAEFETVEDEKSRGYRFEDGPNFSVVEQPEWNRLEIGFFGSKHRIHPRPGTSFRDHDRRMIEAIGAVLSMRYNQTFQINSTARLEIYRGGVEDHYVAAFIDPASYHSTVLRPSRIASVIETLRTAALSTYENHRVSTGVLLLGSLEDSERSRRVAPPDALFYGVELSILKSMHRLCDGKRTLFLVDQAGLLVDIIDIEKFSSDLLDPCPLLGPIPCAGAYKAHAKATLAGGHVCAVLSPNQEIKLFYGGAQAFAFNHGRWRILDPRSKYAVWEGMVKAPALARALFQAALDLAESRKGGLFVVVNDPAAARGRLIDEHDLLAEVAGDSPIEVTPFDPLAKRALHYLARGRFATELDSSVLEALAGIDGALATDPRGRILAFGAILRHDAAALDGRIVAEGARTTAALVASRFGPVLKVSEDGVVSCFQNGARVWDY